ncbi:MAG TPA: pectin acetylesterase-family hydrolase, partial [Myxococcota bacterium]
AGPAQFVYEEVAGTQCANGTVTGLGISKIAGATSLAVLVNGGGACWDSFSCFGANAAVDLSVTYSDAVLQSEIQPFVNSGLVDRSEASNPIHNASMAFVPYCTADLQDGTSVRQYQADLLGQDIRTVHHAGRTNMQAFTARLASDFPAVTQVFLIGASAGGYGAILNDDLFVAAFLHARVDVLVDGAPFVAPQNGLYFTWQSQWTMALPACTNCDTDLSQIVQNLRTAQPDRRFALVTSSNDEVIRLFFGYGLNDMTPQVNALVAAQYQFDNSKAFELTSTQHVLLTGYHSIAGLKDFFDGWAANDARWATYR